MPDLCWVLSQDHQEETTGPAPVELTGKQGKPITQLLITTELLVTIQLTSACEMGYPGRAHALNHVNGNTAKQNYNQPHGKLQKLTAKSY